MVTVNDYVRYTNIFKSVNSSYNLGTSINFSKIKEFSYIQFIDLKYCIMSTLHTNVIHRYHKFPENFLFSCLLNIKTFNIIVFLIIWCVSVDVISCILKNFFLLINALHVDSTGLDAFHMHTYTYMYNDAIPYPGINIHTYKIFHYQNYIHIRQAK